MVRRLWIRLVLAFGVLLVAGTAGLLYLLNRAYQAQAHTEFQALAKANADFIRATRLPRSDRLAANLSQVLGVEVYFRPLAAPDARWEAVTVPLAGEEVLTLARQRLSLGRVWWRPETMVVLAVFWGLWLGLGLIVAWLHLKAERLALLGLMSTALAHEIQNPVAAIRLHGQLLERAGTPAAALIVDEAGKLEGLVNQWLYLAKPEPPRTSAVELAAILKQSVRLLMPAADHARVRIVLHTTAERTVQADARRLSQVFHNILLNAIQAMATGGTLTITLDQLGITFVDTGPGFSPQALRRWREMMYSEKPGGMGIGLSVAQEIVRAHGGQLTIANQTGGGARVQVDL